VCYGLRDDLIGYIIYREEIARPGLAMNPEHFGSWWPELQQRFLIYNYLRYLVLKSSELRAVRNANSMALLLYTRDVISRPDPETAGAIQRLVEYQASWDSTETRREILERETERSKQSRDNENGSVHFFTLPTS
jgi:hypothetical protein